MLASAAACLSAGTLARVTVVLPGGPATPGGEERALAWVAGRGGVRVVLNDDPPAGLSRSLRLGLDAIAEDGAPGEPGASGGPGEPGAAVVLLGDQPRVRPSVVAALVAAWRAGAGPIVAPRYAGAGGAPGNPVLLDRSAWSLAGTLSGDTGMAAVMRARPELVSYLDVPGDNPDVDTPADLAALARG